MLGFSFFAVLCTALLAATLGATPAGASPPSADAVAAFERVIRPLLANKCYACHGPEVQEGGLRLDMRPADESMLLPDAGSRGGLLAVVLNKDDAVHPLVELTAQELESVLAWVSSGAPWPADVAYDTRRPSMEGRIAAAQREHWAFQPVRKPQILSEDTDRGEPPASPIDALVRATLKQAGLEPFPPAPRRTLLRRVHYDLTGLPPTLSEMERFEQDTEPEALARVVDQLLESPQYGERWGRHWLDIARYSDTRASSDNEDRYFPFSHTYRDYVIRAFNEDLPYDQFLLHQIAADQLDLGEDRRPLAGLGFLTLGRTAGFSLHDIVDDRIDVVTRGLLGMSVSCARCHDHKSDPVPTADYYSLYGIFRSAQAPAELPLIEAPDRHSPAYQEYAADLKRLEAARDNMLNALHAELVAHAREKQQEYREAAREAMDFERDAEFQHLAEARALRWMLLKKWRNHLRQTVDIAPAVRQAALDTKADLLPIDVSEVAELVDQETRVRLRQRRAAIERHKSTHPGRPNSAMALENTPKPFEPQVFLRGDPGNPGPEVPRQFLAVLSRQERAPFETHGRLELAQAIASRDNPLTARVFVNRVWMHLFGKPLVGTPSDFGVEGDLPTHPELLDYLAWQFMEDGWSIKQLHRRILLSQTYQQASDEQEAGQSVDPENRLIWRQNRRRLDFEAMRDSMLKVAHHLDLNMGGVAVDITKAPFATRRTVYAEIDREDLPSMFRVFDFAPPGTHSPYRFNTTVPQQALFMMNSPFVAEQARHIALQSDGALASEARIRSIYRNLYMREPSDQEIALGREFIEGQDIAEQSIPHHEPSDWRYGYGSVDAAAGKVLSFSEFPYWSGEAYQGAAELPAPDSGMGMLNRLGGHPGGPGQAVLRRWTSPVDSKVSCVGELHHYSAEGDGIAAWIISSREGILWQGEVQDGMITTVFDHANIRAGDTIDLIVDCREDTSDDLFRWHPRLYLTSPEAATLPKQDWLTRFDFQGPPPEPPLPLKPWEQYAQVLLMSNEFMFVD